MISEDLIFVGGPQATFSDLQAINQQEFSLLLEPAKLSTNKEVAPSLANEKCIYQFFCYYQKRVIFLWEAAFVMVRYF